jgi:hypothetical protein
MTVTIFGFLVVLLGTWILLRGSAIAMLSFVMAMSLMSGAAAFVLTGLGGSTVPPAPAAVPFLVLRCLLPGSGRAPAVQDAIRGNIMLIAFAVYGALSAYILPRIFAGRISVTPLRPIPTDDPFVTFPLLFSPQNVTVSVYLLLTMAGGICAYVAVRSPGAAAKFARMAAIIAIVHASLGFISVLLAGTPAAGLLEFFRNGFYAQLDQTVQGFVRMNGIAPEPSGYAAFGLAYFVMVTELWIRDVDPFWTRFASCFLLLALLTSTSSTAYIGIAGYAIISVLRALVFPGSISGIKVVGIVIVGILAAIGAASVLILQPMLFDTIGRIASRILFEKQDSLSGMQRLMWAKQGWQAFWATGGLGIGMGSFRSSSLMTAILGSTGVVGMVTFAAHMLRVLRPFRQSTYLMPADTAERVGIAASWTAVIMLVPASATAASPDPGLTWGILGGVALGLRRHPSFRRAANNPALT